LPTKTAEALIFARRSGATKRMMQYDSPERREAPGSGLIWLSGRKNRFSSGRMVI